MVGVASKVTKLLTMGLDRRKVDKLNLDDGLEWESKTITSAIKTFFRNLPQPIMTYKTHMQFIEAGSEYKAQHDKDFGYNDTGCSVLQACCQVAGCHSNPIDMQFYF